MIDPTSRVHPSADLEADVAVGPRTSIWHCSRVQQACIAVGFGVGVRGLRDVPVVIVELTSREAVHELAYRRLSNRAAAIS